ncbi:MAG: GNAT family N-acetyltransferase [Oscillospiraceae bacterium]|nr:GNAT family N-acetyltransferase [Oscillospiraceae bacterium]
MRDFPIFTTEYGVSSLFLKEIPYKKEAYIRIRDVQEDFFAEHMEECISFCRMAGAERIFAAGHKKLEGSPVFASVYEMRCTAWAEPDKLASLFPVTETTVSRWRQLHNEAMRSVDNAGTLEARDEQKLLGSIGAYFIHDNGELLGIGWVEDCKLLAVAAVKKGAGERVMHTLMSLCEGAQMVLEVASTNERAIRLYEKLGFLKTAELTRWYQVL